jgi:zinc protease
VVYKLPDDYFASFAHNVEAVTIADVRRVAEAHLDPKRMSIVLVGDRATVSPQVSKLDLGPFELLDVNGKPAPPPPPSRP